MKTLIKNCNIVNHRSDLMEQFDILIEDKTIVKIAKNINETYDNFIDAMGMYVLPGLVDAHCHLREPGYEYKEDIASGALSAIHGGFTAIACMPNTNPVIDNESLIEYIYKRSKEVGLAKVYPIAALSKNQEGKQLTEIGILNKAGAIAFSDDGNPVDSASFMKKALIYANTYDCLIISHCEDKDIVENGDINEGYMSTTLGLNGIASPAEDVMVYRDVRLAEYTNSKLHIAHVSTRQSVEVIRQAKKRGVKVTCETCPHYFTLTDKACDGFNTLAKVNPPLRSDDDVQAIKEGLKDGTIDIIVTDHAPHHIDEKNVEFTYASNGIVGFETAFSLAYTHLVKTNIITLSQLVEKMSYNPAKILNIEVRKIEKGKIADLIIVDLNNKYTIDINKFKSKSKNSPFNGFEVYGEIKNVFVEGKKII